MAPKLHTVEAGLIWEVPSFLSPADCATAIASAESRGFTAAPVTTARGPVMRTDIRNNTRLMEDNPALAAALWGRLESVTPPQGGAFTPVGLNERFRWYRYDPGERFAFHSDGAFVRSALERSLLTCMIYLNEDFEGGETNFVPNIQVKPETGKVLLFKHAVPHEGAAVTRGRKYVLRTDVMYRHG
jgi:prolyl 4-hydroxylase